MADIHPTADDTSTDEGLSSPRLQADRPTASPAVKSVFREFFANKWVLVGLGVFVAAIIAVIFLSFRPVPNVVGMNVIKAQEALTEAGFTHDLQIPVELGEVSRSNLVIASQEIGGGEHAKKGRTLRLEAEGAPLQMPDFVGMAWSEFVSKNSDLGLQVQNGSDETLPLFIIAEQLPGAGETAKYGSQISFKFEAPQVKMPDLVGRSLDEANEALGVLGVEAEDPHNALAVVMTQSMDPGKLVEVHEPIEIGWGVKMPNIVGSTPNDAEDMLKESGITSFTHTGGSSMPITKQKPAAGTIISSEQAVTASSPKHHQIYRVESNGSFGSVTWGLSSIQQENDVALPWERRTESESWLSGKINLVAQTMDGTSITCKLIVDGEVVLENTSTGPYAVVTCSRF